MIEIGENLTVAILFAAAVLGGLGGAWWWKRRKCDHQDPEQDDQDG